MALHQKNQGRPEKTRGVLAVTPRTYLVSTGGHELRVTIRRDGSHALARVDDGPEVPVELESVEAPLHVLRLGDRHVELLALRARDATSVALAGRAYELQVVDEARARLLSVASSASGLHARRELKAPMPGLVVKLLVETGASVHPGQPLVVLQAMKMENELSLPHEGIVKGVHVSAGQTVEQGQLLVVVE